MTIDGEVIWSIAPQPCVHQCRADTRLPSPLPSPQSHPHHLPPARMHSTTLPHPPISTPSPARPRTPHLSVVPLPSPRTLQLQHTTAVRRRADRTAEGHHSCLARRCPAPGRILYCGAVLIADRPTQRLPGGASGQHPGGRSSSPWSGCLDACLLSIASLCPLLGVHLTRPAVQGPGVPPSGVQPSGVQAVRCPGRPVSGCLAPLSGRGCPAIWCPARPASSRLVSVRPPGRSRLVPPQPGAGGGGTPGTARQRSRLDRVEFQVDWSPSPAAGSTARGGMDAGTAAEVGCRPAGSVGGGPGPGRAGAGGCTRATRQARPPRGRLSLPTALGQGSWLARCCRTAPCGRPSAPGVATTLRGRCGA